MTQTQQTPETLPQKVLRMVQVSERLSQKAAAYETEDARRQAAVAGKIPAILDALIKNERIHPHEREKVAADLQNHEACLDKILLLAGHRNATELAQFKGGPGNAGAEKKASLNPHRSLTNPHVGARSTDIKASDVALFRGLGLDVPTE